MTAEIRAIADFLEFKRHNQGKAPRTVQAYGDALDRLAQFLSPRDVLAASEDELTMFCGPWLHKQGVLALSRRPYIAAVREFYKWATLTRRISDNPAAGISYPKTGRKLPTLMSLENAEKLMWAPDFTELHGVRDAAMFAVIAGCGTRVGGLVSLNEGNLAMVTHDGQPRLVLRVTEKGEKERIVPVPRETEVLIRLYLEHPELKAIDRTLPDGDKVLFVSTKNRTAAPHEYIGERRRIAARTVRDRIMHYGERAGIPVEQRHPHALRHLFGTELAEGEVDLLMRQDLMGHEDAKHTKIYTHMATRRKIEAVDKAGPMAKIKTPAGELLARLKRTER